MATIDHVSGGRSGINIVCGWNKPDFAMFGILELPHDERYVQGQEWFDIWSRLLSGSPEPFDYDGKHFPDRVGITGMPGSLQSPGPVVFSAAYSPAGRDFADPDVRLSLTVVESVETGRAEVDELNKKSAQSGRETPPGCIAVAYVVCRETREEAEAFHKYYALDNADHAGRLLHLEPEGQAALPEAFYNELRIRMAAGNGGYPLVGSPRMLPRDSRISSARASRARR